VAHRGKSGIHLIIRSLKSKGLIEIVEMGNGRGYATVYRFRTEDARYPEPRKKASTSECTDMPEKASTPRCTLPEINRPPAGQKGSSNGAERVHLEAGKGTVATDTTSLEALPQIPSTTPSNDAKPLGAVSSVSNSKANPTDMEKIAPYLRRVRDVFHERMSEEKCDHDTLNLKSAKSLFDGRAREDVEYIVCEFLASRSWKGLVHPEAKFMEEFPDYFDAFLENAAKEKRERENIKRQIAEHTAKCQAEFAVRDAERLAEKQAEEQDEASYRATGVIQL
jgi:hypothetical protein